MKNNVACIHRGHAKPFSVVINHNLFLNFSLSSTLAILICYDMDALRSHVVKFSLRHILNAGQYDFLSHFDSFGDIPGHGAVYFLGRKILWTLKSNLVLFFGMSFIALYIIYRRGKWSEMPVDQNRRLSVTFPDCLVSSVLGTVSVVAILSYNFSTGEKQHGSLFKSFVEQHIKISHQEVFFVYSFQLSDIFNLEFRILQAEGRMFNGEIFFDSSGVTQQIFIVISFLSSFFPFKFQPAVYILLAATMPV